MTLPAAGRPAIRLQGQRVSLRYLLLLPLILAAGCDEPFIVLSGEKLAGESVAPPEDWTEANEADVVQLETRLADAYSVNLWMAGIGSDVYVATGDDDTNWTVNLATDPDVRLRIGNSIYELTARKVTDLAERKKVAAEYVKKYGLDEDDNWVLDGQVFRLDRR